jgi:hypothetical protein
MLNRADQAASMPFQPYQGPRVAGFNPQQEAALNQSYMRGMTGSPATNAATQLGVGTMGGAFLQAPTNQQLQNYAYDTIGGQGLSPQNNPALQNWSNYLTDQVVSRHGAALGRNFGNSGLRETVGDAVSRAQAPLYGLERQLQANTWSQEQNRLSNLYGLERGNMQSAMGMAPGLSSAGYQDLNAALSAGGARQNLTQQLLDVPYSDWQQAQAWPQYQLGLLGQGLQSGSVGGTMTGPNPNQGNRASSAIGGALSGFGVGGIPGAIIGGIGGLLA